MIGNLLKNLGVVLFLGFILLMVAGGISYHDNYTPPDCSELSNVAVKNLPVRCYEYYKLLPNQRDI